MCTEWRTRQGVPCKFSWCPPWRASHDGGAVSGACNLKSSQVGPARGGQEVGENNWHPSRPQRLPLILPRQCSKLPRNSPCNQPRSQAFSGTCTMKKPRLHAAVPAIVSLLNAERLDYAFDSFVSIMCRPVFTMFATALDTFMYLSSRTCCFVRECGWAGQNFRQLPISNYNWNVWLLNGIGD